MRPWCKAPTWIGIVLFLLVSDTALAPELAHGQDGGPCLDCVANENAGEPRSMEVQTDTTQTSLFTTSDSWTIRKRVDEVTIFFSATDRHQFVHGLNLDDIRVIDDGKTVKRISAFGVQSDLPLRLGLMIDTSSSVNPKFRFEQQASVQFLRQVVRPGRDQAFVVGFADHMNVTQDYSDNPENLAAGVAELRNGGGTAFFDAIVKASEKLMLGSDSEPAARVLVVLSDGDDNASDTTLAQAIERSQMRDVTIYTLNTSNKSPQPSDAALKQLAKETGGRYFSEMSTNKLKQAFAAIEKEIRNRYALSYQPDDLQDDGRFRRIRITAEKSGRRFRVHTRKGYYAPLAPSAE